MTGGFAMLAHMLGQQSGGPKFLRIAQILRRIGKIKGLLGQAGKYQRGHGGSITPASSLNMRGVAREKGLAGHCEHLVSRILPRIATHWGEVRWVKATGECWFRS